MKKKHLLSLLITIILILLVFLGLYLSIFNLGLSEANSDWGDFGDYFAGTIGICFTLIGVAFMYLTFYEQRKQQFENGFQQYLSNYFSLLNLIKERWLHNESDETGKPIYQTGREIFGNAVGSITKGDEFNRFIYIFNLHINVFQHHSAFLIEFFVFLSNNNELKERDREIYIDRFFSIMSVYELIFFAYYVEYIYKKDDREILKIFVIKALNNISMSNSAKYKEQYEFIKNVLVLTSPKPQPPQAAVV